MSKYMKRKYISRFIFILTTLGLLSQSFVSYAYDERFSYKGKPHSSKSISHTSTNGLIDISLIEQLTGISGSWDEKLKIYKVTIPRSDLLVKVSGAFLSPSMGLTSWLNFIPKEKNSIQMVGDLVLHENQVNTVMSEALQNNLKVTSLYNHYLLDSPKVMLMRIEGTGSEQALGMALAKIFVKIKENNSNLGKSNFNEGARINPYKTTLKIETIDKIMKKHGTFDEKAYTLHFDRKGYESPIAGVNLNNWVTFSGADKEALAAGSIMVLESELQEFLKALRNANIKVTSIYPQYINKDQKLITIYYWGIGPIEELAQNIRDALDKVEVK